MFYNPIIDIPPNSYGREVSKMKNYNILDWVAIALVIIGGLNWGLVGFFEFDLVEAIFGDMTLLSKIVYDLVGIAALYMIYVVLRPENEK